MILKNQRGQMAIFVAMIFQVLFVLFAMSINVALVVHDKINLQTAADLGAYYAAERQAELLNVIGHQNYQIRQAWKLLSWRYRVLGTLGFPQHPAKIPAPQDEGVWLKAQTPGVCVNHRTNWADITSDQSLCHNENLNVPKLPTVPIIAGFLPINFTVTANAERYRKQFDTFCDNFGAINWWFAAAIFYAYRQDQANRKQVMYALADNLSKNKGDFFDIKGASVKTGVTRTVEKNLTYANANGNPEIELLNSLEGVGRDKWLVEIKTAPTIIFTDAAAGENCVATLQPIRNLPQRAPAREYLLNNLLGPEGRLLVEMSQGEPPETEPMHMSNGVEKNPWYVPYVGVKVKTKPRQLFFPFGDAITMEARAFAKPFGGRIGPWYSTDWPRNSPESTGRKVDEQLPPRTRQGGLLDNPDDPTRLPNYSRFPGDKFGLTSRLAQQGLADLGTIRMWYRFFFHIVNPFGTGQINDTLAWDFMTDQPPSIRQLEIAALAPDLFDIAYYSVEPNYEANYRKYIEQGRQKLGIPANVVIRSDLGNHGNNKPTFTVQEQFETAQKPNPVQKREAFYFVRDRGNLLTGWYPESWPVDYQKSSPGKEFGRCLQNDDNFEVKNPGSCLQGGRVGYSVKIVSRGALVSNEFKIGGVNQPPAAILNPPPPGW